MSIINTVGKSTTVPAAGDDFQRTAVKTPSPLLAFDFTERSSASKPNLAPIGCLPLNVQESLMIKELLAVLQGYSRDYICVLPLENATSTQTFSFDESLDSSLCHYVLEMLPVAALYSRVSRFVDTSGDPVFGMVIHAFGYAARQFLREYQAFLTDREDTFRDGQLTIQKLNYFIMPLIPSFKSLSDTIEIVTQTESRGGAVLSVFFDRLTNFANFRETNFLLLEIFSSSSRPFFEMLSQWMYEGTFEDPFNEFMIKQKKVKDFSKKMNNFSFWENRFLVVFEKTPSFLFPFSDKILRTGKYLNILQQCGHLENLFREEEKNILEFSIEEKNFEIEIEKNYFFASGKLLNLMFESEKLIQKLRTFKHFFLLDEDDFMPEFLFFAADDLKFPVGKIDKLRLFAVFDDAVKTSVLQVDEFKSMIKPTLRGTDLLISVHKMRDLSENAASSSSSDQRKEMLGMNAFTMDCDIKFPLCLIINDEAKRYYQILFQNLFRLKVVEWNLTRLWTNCVTSTDGTFTVCCSAFVHQMLEFIKSLQHYFSAEVIEPNWHLMMTKIKTAKTFDEVFEEHQEFIASCSKDCLLASSEILQVLYKVVDTCGRNCVTLQDPQFVGDVVMMTDTVATMKEKLGDRVANLLILMHRENREFEYKLIGAIHRLDFNDFYKLRHLERNRFRSDATETSATPATSATSTTSAIGSVVGSTLRR